MPELFGRVCWVEFGPAGGVGKRFTGLDTTFTIKKGRTSGTSPNYSDITIFGLNAESSTVLQQRDSVVRLFAGTGFGSIPSLIFQGNPIPNGVRTDFQGPEKTTKIEALDGGFVLQDKRISIQSNANTTLTDLFDKVTDQLGLPRGTVALPPTANVLADPWGYNATGSAVPLLNEVADSLNCDWWIDSGKLNLVGRGRPTSSEAIVISLDNGNLVGSPDPKTLIGSATKSNDGTEITCILNPAITPGRLVQVASKQVTGVFIAQRVEHHGDSRSGPWYTKILGIPYSTRGPQVTASNPGGESSGGGRFGTNDR